MEKGKFEINVYKYRVLVDKHTTVRSGVWRCSFGFRGSMSTTESVE